MIESRYSFKLISKEKKTKIYPDSQPKTIESDEALLDSKKRSFMKLAGVLGVGAVAATFLPKKAEALVFGSTPTSNTVALRNVANTKINPAMEDGNLATVATNTNLLTFDAGIKPANLKINVAAGAVGLKNSGGTPINPATEDTLSTINTQIGKLTFGTGNVLSTAAGSQDITGTRVNPATDDSIVWLRRMVKLMESQAVVDSSNRQKITLDSITAALTLATITNITTVSGQGQQMYQDVARNTYANGIRQNLTFT